jgi:hypothetical protein
LPYITTWDDSQSQNRPTNSAEEAEIVPGTYIYFDEFNHRNHELRAFDEFRNETGMRFSLVGVTRTMEHAAFRRDS